MNRQNIIRSINTTHGSGQAQLILPNGWDYLVKVKLKNMEKLLESQTWIKLIGNKDIAICAFSYKANDILWQLSVFAYNISVMMRQKKNKFTKQEQPSFIEWFIAVPAKITRSGHQTELKIYEHHFYKADWEKLDRLIEAS